jgi:exopolyphosphatase/guanosine-5'-triphosphate,3'-diphosphate pyrophosphatase
MVTRALRQDVGPRDRTVIAKVLGRPPRDLTGIAARCPFGYPAVIETAPLLEDGTPNPTLLYLTCPAVAIAVSRVEEAGGVRAFRETCAADSQIRGVMQQITELYQRRRQQLAGTNAGVTRLGARLGAGIGGPEGPETASCLHAYAAALLAVLSGWLVDEDEVGLPVTTATMDRESESGASQDEREVSAGEMHSLVSRAQQAWLHFLPPLESSWCTDTRCARWDTGLRPAAIDIGTISVRLLVADMSGERPKSLVRKVEVTRLGEGLRPGGALGEAAKQRTAEVVARYANEARQFGADSILATGTSATREAADGTEFMDSLGRENGIAAVVLSETREAELAYAGASLDVPGNPIVIDIGGGSTELSRRFENGLVRSVSLEIGANRATERWLHSDPPSTGEIADVREDAKRAIEAVAYRFLGGESDLMGREPLSTVPLVGVAGTVTTLACIDSGLKAYNAEFLHLRPLSREAVRRLVTRLSTLTTAERAALPCVQAGRASVLVGGAIILLAALDALGYDRLIVSEKDLLDGLVMRGVG